MADGHRVRFLPSDRMFVAEEGESILDLAMKSGIHINASCGGNGACGKCRIKVIEGNVASAPHPKIAQWEYENGIRLACMTRSLGDVVVEIPFESQVDRAALRRKRETSHVLTPADLDQLVGAWEVDPSVFKKYLELEPPSVEDNINDLGRLMRELRKRHEIEDVSVDFKVLMKLAGILRASDWKITLTLVETRRGLKLINVEAGNVEDKNYSIVIDIGTTTVCGQLLDLANCSVYRRIEDSQNGVQVCTLGEASDYNAQISYGEDVITRILYAQKQGGLKRIQEVVIGTINGIIKELLEMSGVSVDRISHLVFAGNTTMTHLALGLDPRYIMLSPYTPTANFIPPVRAINLGLNVKDHVHIYLFPCVASYVGGDIVAGVLGSGLFKRSDITLFLDIGTNGELVVGNKDWLTCASCSAGPAFEGGGIKFGMRAGRGAIEQVRINPTTLEPMILTIGRVKPAGICGSGLIDAVAELLEAGVIGQNGKFERDLPTKRVREGDSGFEYVLAYAADTQIGRDIVLTEVDLDNLIRAKAAIYAGCKVLLENVGLSFADVNTIIIAGGFGHYIDVEKAQMIGLLPDVSSEKFIFVGNGSLLGARLLSFSRELLRETERIARTMTNIELSNSTTFMDEFIAAMFLPHTDEKAFPAVLEQLRAGKEAAVSNA
ncbi:MAG TPA: ASKHA domain-containing protein [Syntrophorhabdales bacterium]|nr:ASKHA domain-containing protein [Syntrophorhabdales bacterium]